MTEREALSKVEEIVDALGLSVVLATMGTVCAEKAEHLRANWQDNRTANVWARAGRSIDKLAHNDTGNSL